MNRPLFIKPKPKRYPYVIALIIVAVGFMWLLQSDPKTVEAPSTPKVYHPVSYDVSEWERHAQMSKPDFEMLKGLVGHSATQTDTLDFYGNMANKYSFVSAYEPTLYVVESKESFELAWYFAHTKDDEKTKQTSQKYAQKAYQVITALYGDDGRWLLQNMLDEEVPTFEDESLLLARCRDYLCRLVVKK
ncbi:hypothetical protein [Moraxella oblonga]|uniref:hypothetical protein n=1 Tax=Moraxella oblonga TaxID=200413 RepID=UPI0008297F7C|nr:hypothetical protein [Moraxella oblonga]